jgi:hypothetical protein
MGGATIPIINAGLGAISAFSGGGSSGASTPWQDTSQKTMNYTNSKIVNPIQLGGYYTLANRAGFDSNLLKQYANSTEMNQFTRALGWTPIEGFTAAEDIDPAKKQTTWGQWSSKNLPAVQDQSTNTVGGIGTTSSGINSSLGAGGVYSTAEEQAIINSSFRQAANAIDQAARQKYSQLVGLGMDADQAMSASLSWAENQKMKNLLSGTADLRTQSINEQQRRLEALLGLGNNVSTGATSSSSGASYGNSSDDTDMWAALAQLGSTLGSSIARSTSTGSKA